MKKKYRLKVSRNGVTKLLMGTVAVVGSAVRIANHTKDFSENLGGEQTRYRQRKTNIISEFLKLR
jgi:hypothetical protein